jgi:MFS family permease
MEQRELKSLVKNSATREKVDTNPVNGLNQSLKHLLMSEKSLFYMFIVNFLVSLQYYILVTIMPLYFTSQYKFTDLESGLIFGGFGVVIGVSSLYLSSILHIISFKLGLIISAALGILGFILMLYDNLYLSVLAVLTFQAVSCSLSWPFVEFGIKMYSSVEIRNLSSSCYFMTNYFAGFIAGVLIDFVWTHIPDKTQVYSIVYGTGILFLLVSAFFVHISRDISNTEKEVFSLKGLYGKKRFWRFLVLIGLLILLRSACFGHLDATLPKYMVREYKDDAHFGVMLALHSVTMMIGLFSLTALTFSYSSYNLITFGAVIGVIGSLFIIIAPGWLGIIMFVVCISIGESIWVPRLLDYTYSIAPEGEEGVYLSMSNFPFYFGMILTGATSGYLLDNFCSENKKENCNFIWVFVMLSSSCIPLLLIALKPFILQPNSKFN